MALGPIKKAYNLVSWEGSATAYMTCNLGSRAPEYSGRCAAAANVTCRQQSGNATMPYLCTDLKTGIPGPGDDLSDPAYRLTCSVPCDRAALCASLCQCPESSCHGPSEICLCRACLDTALDASLDPEVEGIEQETGVNHTGVTHTGSGVSVLRPS